MKIVLSRKGFDAENGGGPSPILPDNTLLFIPIPTKSPPLRYSDLYHNGHSFGKIVEDLSHHNFTRKFGKFVHLDPDIRPDMRSRPSGWLPLFGQVLAARGHLINQSVGINALFLFFGRFRRIELAAGHYSFVKDAPDIHVIFGWLQVGQVSDLSKHIRLPNWAKDFPHYGQGEGTIVYTAKEKLDLKGIRNGLPGAGVFEKYRDDLQLTKNGESKSIWQLPRWFYPFDPNSHREPLTYHPKKDRWEIQNHHVVLSSVAKGQEFVFDTADYPESFSWLRTLFRA